MGELEWCVVNIIPAMPGQYIALRDGKPSAILQGWFLSSEAPEQLLLPYCLGHDPSGKTLHLSPSGKTGEDVDISGGISEAIMGRTAQSKHGEIRLMKSSGEYFCGICCVGRTRKIETAVPVRTRIELHYKLTHGKPSADNDGDDTISAFTVNVKRPGTVRGKRSCSALYRR